MGVPGSVNNLLGAGGAPQYKIERSLRFNSSDSAYLSRVPSTAGNRKTWTWAGWVKRSSLNSSGGTYQQLFTAGSSVTVRDVFFFDQDVADTLAFYSVGSGFGGGVLLFRTNAVFRDPSAWYHIILAVDTTQATAANRIKLYVNGVQQTFSTANYPSQNSDGLINSTTGQAIGRDQGQAAQYLNGYLADIHFIDGQALDPTSFGEFSATTGVWVPKAYTGSYGTNGFRLDFSDNSAATATTLGKDRAGSNNWTPTNFSVSSGAGNDSLVDTPTSYGTDDSLGGSVRGNYCTLNPLDQKNANTLSNGNLDCVLAGSGEVYGTQGVSSGKWYFEIVGTATADSLGRYAVNAGIANLALTQSSRSSSGSWMYYTFSGEKYSNGSYSAYGNQVALNDVLGVAVDLDNSKIWFSKNGTWQNSGNPATGANAAFTNVSGTIAPAVFNGSSNSTNTFVLNTGSRAFAYTAPSGFKALCDTNLPAPVVAKPNTVFDAITWTGNGSSQAITLPGGFSPDLVWLKQRNGTDWHALFNTIVGATTRLFSNSTSAEATNTQTLTAFNSNGFSVGNTNEVNGSGNSYVAWCFDAGSSTVSNTQGSITSQVRANASAGFSIVTYTGTRTSNGTDTIGHGLGVAPELILIKRRDGAADWHVKHKSLTSWQYALTLNSTGAQYQVNTTYGTMSAPTSAVFSTSYTTDQNVNGYTYVAYCFSPVVGYSAIGSYDGNSSADGPFVYTGFRPRFIMVKNAGATTDWVIVDTARETFNVVDDFLRPNSSAAEGTRANLAIDILSNGFKHRGLDNFLNGSNTHVYIAFAESPFAYSRAR